MEEIGKKLVDKRRGLPLIIIVALDYWENVTTYKPYELSVEFNGERRAMPECIIF